MDKIERVIRWILFDAVGTLIYPDPPIAEAYYAAAHDYGSHLAIDEIALRFRVAFAAELGVDAASESNSLSRPRTNETQERRRWQRIVAQAIDDVPSNNANALFERLWTHFAQAAHWRLYDDLAPALTGLAARSFRLGIASNFDSRLHNIIAGHPALKKCEKVFVSSHIGFTKPDPRFFAAITEQLAVPPDQILLVGDDERADIIGAKAAGWQALRLNRDPQNGAPCSITTLGALPSLFDKN